MGTRIALDLCLCVHSDLDRSCNTRPTDALNKYDPHLRNFRVDIRNIFLPSLCLIAMAFQEVIQVILQCYGGGGYKA